MDAFAWGVIGSVASVVGVIAVVIPIVQSRRKARHDSSDDWPQVELRGGRGVQVGTGNRQVNQYIQTYIEAQPPDGERLHNAVIVGEIRQAPSAFQPREDLLAAVEAGGPGMVLVRALTGMRGVGKTPIAAAYARSRIDAGWRLVAWINAADPAGILSGLADIASGLGITRPGLSLESADEAVRHWLEADGDRCLVVFDNATDLDHLARFLPAAGRSQVVLTSNQVAAGSFGTVVPVRYASAAQIRGEPDLGYEFGFAVGAAG